MEDCRLQVKGSNLRVTCVMTIKVPLRLWDSLAFLNCWERVQIFWLLMLCLSLLFLIWTWRQCCNILWKIFCCMGHTWKENHHKKTQNWSKNILAGSLEIYQMKTKQKNKNKKNQWATTKPRQQGSRVSHSVPLVTLALREINFVQYMSHVQTDTYFQPKQCFAYSSRGLLLFFFLSMSIFVLLFPF